MSNDIPDVSTQLGCLTKGIPTFSRFSAKKSTVVVPTDFPGLNRATRIGGVSAPATLLLHGPSKGGKTALAIGLIVNFQRQGHLVAFVDAERTLDVPWALACGVDGDQLIYDMPNSYEETVQNIDQLITNFKKGRAAGTIHEHTCLLIIVDSITKLVPENELKKLAKDDRMYPLRAMMNTAWLDKLTVTIGDLPVLFTIIAHEKKKMNAMPFEEQWHVKGGDALIYDSSLQMRVSVKKKIKEGDPKAQVGKLHHCVVHKNKVGIDGEQFYFVMSNGKGDAPIGFDKPKELLEECKLRGEKSPLVRGNMGKWTWDTLPEKEIRGDKRLENLLRDKKQLLDKLLKELDESSGSVRVVEFDPNNNINDD